MYDIQSQLPQDLLQFIAGDSHLLQMTIDTLPVPIFYKDVQGIYLGCNKAFEDFIKLKREELVGFSVHQLFDKELADIYHAADQALFSNPGIQIYEKQIRTSVGEDVYVKFHKTSFNDSNGNVAGLIGVIFDITEQKKLEMKLQRKAAYDDLTGLLNRCEGMRIGLERFDNAIATGNDFGLIMIDVDHFKEINDNYGHGVGDEALRHIAMTLAQSITLNEILIRWGGEEFIVLVMAGTVDSKSFAHHLQKTAEQCRQTLVQTPFTQVTPAQTITISCGLAYFTGKSWEQLLHDADLALYRAKDKGRNTVSF
ncbi:hypothetical protein TUM4644_37290 [Shewanella colwelliana]|uniref:GGDEF domain-containing protein n=1 Tax=Shewanella colwelliana TaxID=23 RepID=UPI001BC11BF8|nr:GGDEF domain-containing protein [Shewanella colwelliana]GIU36252.1 hypothetical protein TUM4644_37290 [Shewanella colwelliana]